MILGKCRKIFDFAYGSSSRIAFSDTYGNSELPSELLSSSTGGFNKDSW